MGGTGTAYAASSTMKETLPTGKGISQQNLLSNKAIGGNSYGMLDHLVSNKILANRNVSMFRSGSVDKKEPVKILIIGGDADSETKVVPSAAATAAFFQEDGFSVTAEVFAKDGKGNLVVLEITPEKDWVATDTGEKFGLESISKQLGGQSGFDYIRAFGLPTIRAKTERDSVIAALVEKLGDNGTLFEAPGDSVKEINMHGKNYGTLTNSTGNYLEGEHG
jgi:hypothetical protein